MRSVLPSMLWIGLCLAVVGCSDSGSAPPKTGGGAASGGAGGTPGQKTLRIAVIPKGTTHDFWKSVHAGALDAAQQNPNIQVIWNGPDNEKDKEQQIKIVDTFVNDKVDGICIAPIDRDALIEPIRRAKQAGIPVVVFDSGLSDTSDIISYVATDNYQGGVIAARHLAGLLSGEGGVVMLRYLEGSESTEQREQGFLDTLKKEFPKVEILSENQHVNSDASEALQKGTSILQDLGSRVKGVFTVCEPNNKGMLQALEDLQMAGKVKFVGFDSDPLVVRGLSEDKVHGVVLQNPVKMGFLAVSTIADHIAGKPVEKRVSTGEELATRENMETEAMKALLDPKQAN